MQVSICVFDRISFDIKESFSKFSRVAVSRLLATIMIGRLTESVRSAQLPLLNSFELKICLKNNFFNKYTIKRCI
jgi:hypothetical protein